MRKFLLAAVMCGMTAGAQAADLSDLPILRGGLTEGMGARVNWSGVYVGGQVTRGAADMDFTNSGQDLLAKLLNNIDLEAQFNISKWPVGRAGPCVGHRLWRLCRIQFPMDRCGHRRRTELHPRYAVRFLEGRPGTYLPVSDRLRYDGDGLVEQLDAADRLRLAPRSWRLCGRQLAALRICRCGAGTGRYQPQGRCFSQLSLCRHQRKLPSYSASGFLTDNANSHLVTGFAAGLGFDWMLCAGLFMRAEFEYLRFTSTVDTSVSTARLGLGYKF